MISPARSEPYPPFRHLAKAIGLNHDPRECYFAVPTAYFDASGKPSNSAPPTLFVAGFLAKVEEWDRFELAWNAALTEHEIHVPFHATDFFNGRAGFERFSHNPPARAAFLADAVSVIEGHCARSFSCGVYLHQLREICSIYDFPEHSHVPYPYALCGLLIIGAVEAWRRREGVTAPIKYVFEDGDDHRGKLIRACNDVGKHLGVSLSPAFEDKKTVAALQAADLLAWLSTKWTTLVEQDVRGGKSPGTTPPPKWLDEIAHRIGADDWNIVSRGDLESYCERAGLRRR